MSNQQKDQQPSSGGAGQALHEQAKDSTGGAQGDVLSNAVDAAAGGDAGKTGAAPPRDKGGAPAA